MMLLVGMRDETVGVDSPQYVYRYALDYDFEGILYEPLYQLSVTSVNLFTPEYGWWFLFISFITFLLIGIAFCRYSVNPLLSVLIFMISTVHLFPETMNIMRQSVAIAALLLSYLTCINKKWISTILLFIVAVGFHFSSILVLPFYFICKIKFNKLFIIISLIITFIMGFFTSSFISLDILGNLIPGVEGALEVGMEKLGNYEDRNALNYFGLISTMLPIMLLCMFLIPNDKDERSYKYLFNFYYVGTLISNLIYCAIPFGFRYSYPFFAVESILFAYKYRNNKGLRLYIVFFILLFIYYLIVLSMETRPNMIIPYKFNKLFVS